MTDDSRRDLILVERASALVLRCLRRAFPDDYDRRCIYAAAGLKHLLSGAGMDARLHAGDFLALVVARDGSRAGLQGFGGGDGREAYSHYWVETPRRLVDLDPHLLPRSSSFAAAPLPLICWDKGDPAPIALHYRAAQRYAPDATMRFPAPIADRMSNFLDELGGRWMERSGATSSSSWSWMLTGEGSLRLAARRDVWAKGVLRFEREIDPASLPF